MLKKHGTFEPYDDPRRNGYTFKNENGMDWQRFVMRRVLFNDFGKVIELYDTDDEIVDGDRYFAAVKDGIVVASSWRDPSPLSAMFPAEVVETDIQIGDGDIFTGKGFKAAPPPPFVVHKQEVISAFNDDMHGAWVASFPEATPKQRNTWDNMQTFTQGTEDYQTAQSLVVGILGPDGYTFFPK